MAVERKKRKRREKEEKKSMIIVVPSSDRLTACTATLGPIDYRRWGSSLPDLRTLDPPLIPPLRLEVTELIRIKMQVESVTS